jgi:hypothetical protein
MKILEMKLILFGVITLTKAKKKSTTRAKTPAYAGGLGSGVLFLGRLHCQFSQSFLKLDASLDLHALDNGLTCFFSLALLPLLNSHFTLGFTPVKFRAKRLIQKLLLKRHGITP